MKTYEQMAESVLKRTDIILKEKARKRTVAARTSVAAALTAIMSAGIWLVIDNGDGGDTSTPILQNPSEDTPLTPGNPSEEISTPDTSTDEIDWDSIRLNAVYGGKHDAFSQTFHTMTIPGLFLSYAEQSLVGYPDDTVFAMCLYIHTEGYEHEWLLYQKIYDEIRSSPKYMEKQRKWGEILDDLKDVRGEEYEKAKIEWEMIQWQASNEAWTHINNMVTEEDIGREMLFADLETIGIRVFTRNCKMYYNREKMQDELARLETYYVAYLTKNDIKRMEELIIEKGIYGVNLVPAYDFLKDEKDYRILVEYYYGEYGE